MNPDETEEFFIEHFGTKGMKWGRRKNKAPLTKRQMQAKKVRREALKAGTKSGAITLALTGAWGAHMVATHDPETAIKTAAFLGKTLRTPAKVAFKAAKGAKLLFGKDNKVKYFPPGTYTPGMFVDAGARAITSGAKAIA